MRKYAEELRERWAVAQTLIREADTMRGWERKAAIMYYDLVYWEVVGFNSEMAICK